jgi:sec-independent protein translocase protein TatB
MFDVSWSELLILGLVTLIFVGPKELPRFLGQLGRYAGVVRRHANEFRAVFEQAMREAEMEELKKEMRSVSDGVKASLDEVTRSVDDVKKSAVVNFDAKPAPPPQALPNGEGAATSETASTAHSGSAAAPEDPGEAQVALQPADDEKTILKPTAERSL